MDPQRDPRRGLFRPAWRGAGKKLKDAGRAWALAFTGKNDPEQPVAIDSQAVEQFAAFGVTVESEELEEETMAIWPENREALEAFLTLQRSWRVVSSAAGIFYQGLDLAVAAALFNGHSKKARKRFESLLIDLRILETAALPILNDAGGET